MGAYPLVAMFPVVAVTGEPSVAAIGGWAAALAALGVAARREASGELAGRPVAPLGGPGAPLSGTRA